MATRKALVLVSGLFQELNSSADKLDFAGNTTADLTEQTNLYFTSARARGTLSVTDSGGDGSLSYDNGTGVFTYTGPSASEARAHLSVATGSGLTYNSNTGEFGTSAIPNSQLENDDLTIGSTAVALGATASSIAGLTSLASTTLIAGVADAANAISIASGNITFEGSTADANETILTATDATGGDKTLTLPNETGTILSTASSIGNSNLTNSKVTIGSTEVNLGDTATTIAGLTSLTSTTLVGTTLISGSADAANSIKLASGNIVFEGSSANDFETTLTVTNPTADRTITFPNATGTVVLLGSLSVASGSGLSYNSSTGEFGTSSIPNNQLANNTIQIGSGSAVALGGSISTLSGMTSITSTNVITDDSGFRIRDNTDNTKQLAFECSGITTSTTRTLTVPDVNGTIITSASANFTSNITTTGTIHSTGNQIKVEGPTPKFTLTDNDNNPDYEIQNNGGTLNINDITSGTTRFTVNSDGHVDVAGNLDVGAGLDVTGNITVTGTVDGKDIATLTTEDFATAISVALG